MIDRAWSLHDLNLIGDRNIFKFSIPSELFGDATSSDKHPSGYVCSGRLFW
jgi:hypothetical protein